MTDQRRPLGKIRTDRFRVNTPAAAAPTEPGRHRRAAAPDAETPVVRIPRPRTPSPAETIPNA